MVFDAFTLSLMLAAVALIIGAVYWAILSVGLQEAGDPDESDPEDLTEFEKRHTDRPDVHTEVTTGGGD
jgi:hypothetical protein